MLSNTNNILKILRKNWCYFWGKSWSFLTHVYSTFVYFVSIFVPLMYGTYRWHASCKSIFCSISVYCTVVGMCVISFLIKRENPCCRTNGLRKRIEQWDDGKKEAYLASYTGVIIRNRTREGKNRNIPEPTVIEDHCVCDCEPTRPKTYLQYAI